MPRRDPIPWHEYQERLQPHERPTFPGSPATPDHPTRLRIAYACVAVLVSVTSSLGSAFVTANLQNLQGALGLAPVEAAWIPVVFVMTNACLGLILVKFRQQYGLRLFTEIFLIAFAAVAFANVFVHDFGAMLGARAAAGMAASGLSTLSFLYFIQAFPPAHRLKGIVLGIGMSTIAAPVARLIGPTLLELGGWRAFHIMELGLSLICLAAVFSLRLPPSERMKAFDPLDFLTFALFAPGVALLAAVLGLGRIVWWTEAPWIGWALVGACVLLGAALAIEVNRKNPLISLAFLASADVARLGLAILLVRVVLSEQTAGAVGFLMQMGLGVEQLHGLFTVILLATIAGVLVSAFTIAPERAIRPIAGALALIALGAFLDSHATAQTRPVNLYFSQALTAFAAAAFLGPAMVAGIGSVLRKGPQVLVSFIVVFSVAQNLGGLAGSALVGSLETVREKYHSNQLAESISLSDPATVQRLQQLAGAYARTIPDPARRQAEATRLLTQQVTQQAHVLAYNDVFRIIAAIAALGSVWVFAYYFRTRRAARKAAAVAIPAEAAGD
ncbi:MFS transporter [Phenylobacterium sp. VNQ135]|uniref:MFS transporter n=1 Tax=Phenylobacterium sp. VNQ135 TaxID=3400922 RepID=UPI003C018E14